MIGVSGGSDSMALLHVLAGLRDELNFKLSAVGVNHNLRADSAAEIEVASTFALSLGVPFYKKDVFLPKEGNTQSNARKARYNAIREVKRAIETERHECVFLVMAHHADDRAETVLMKIVRGIPVKALSILPARFHNKDDDYYVFRPMIRAQKYQVMTHITNKQIPYCEDPSNRNVDKYTRSRIRFEVMPMLKSMNPNIVSALCDLSDSASY